MIHGSTELSAIEQRGTQHHLQAWAIGVPVTTFLPSCLKSPI